MRRQESHSPQKSSFRRSQFAACANIRASVYLPIPRGPVKSKALGTRLRFSIPRRALTIRSLPRNSLNPIYDFTTESESFIASLLAVSRSELRSRRGFRHGLHQESEERRPSHRSIRFSPSWVAAPTDR